MRVAVSSVGVSSTSASRRPDLRHPRLLAKLSVLTKTTCMRHIPPACRAINPEELKQDELKDTWLRATSQTISFLPISFSYIKASPIKTNGGFDLSPRVGINFFVLMILTWTSDLKDPHRGRR